MNRVGILTDSTAGIPQYLVDDLHIEIVPADASVPSQAAYVQGLKNLVARTHAIVALTPTAQATDAYQVCRAAAATVCYEIPELQLQVLDTRQLGMAQGWAAIQAARAAAQNMPWTLVAQHAQSVAARSHMVQTAPTLLDAQVLMSVVNGEIVAVDTAPTRTQAYARIIEYLRPRTDDYRRVHLAFTHCGAEPETEILRDFYFRELDCIEEMTASLAPALAAHSGPGTVGVCLYAE